MRGVALQTQPQITSLIPNPANCKIGMAVDKKKMHNQISIMHFHAQNMQKFVLRKSGHANLSTEVHARSGLEQSRQGLDNDRIPLFQGNVTARSRPSSWSSRSWGTPFRYALSRSLCNSIRRSSAGQTSRPLHQRESRHASPSSSSGAGG
jgi:hypothetical protein